MLGLRQTTSSTQILYFCPSLNCLTLADQNTLGLPSNMKTEIHYPCYGMSYSEIQFWLNKFTEALKIRIFATQI